MVIRRACPLSRRRWWAITVAANVRPIRYRVRGPSRILLTGRSSCVVAAPIAQFGASVAFFTRPVVNYPS